VGLLAEWADVRTKVVNQRMRQFSHPAVIVATIFTALFIPFSMILLKGVKEERKYYLLPWLVWSVLHLLLVVSLAINLR